jgi:hypothetical protein
METFPGRSRFWRGAAILFPALFLLGCAYEKPAKIPFHGPGVVPRLYGLSRDAVSGTVPLEKRKDLEYRFETPLPVPPDYSLELDYLLSGPPAATLGEFLAAQQLVLNLDGGTAWTLPGELSFIGGESRPGPLRYAVPLAVRELVRFSLVWHPRNPEAGPPPEPAGLVFRLREIRLVPRRFGFSLTGPVPRASPFVYRDDSGSLVIDPPGTYRPAGGFNLFLPGATGPFRINAGSRQFDYAPSFREPSPPGSPATAGVDSVRADPVRAGYPLPRALLPAAPFPLVFTGPSPPAAFEILTGEETPHRREPVSADPGIILAYPREAWRDPRYELFRWARFPSILIFDTATYALQDLFFKRLAFFVEKTGFRGRLVPDAELAGLHGWNAHDYRAEDLARFFNAAGKEAFPLSPEEEELRTILLEAGILRSDGGTLSPGGGAVLSLSRESAAYLRNLFMVHEGFHGLFFIDENFREFSRRRWEALDGAAKRFIRSYFDSQRYDLEDSFLMVNEFMAYCLQQPASQAGTYFGETLAARIYATPWRRGALPPGGEAAGVWPELSRSFAREAEAFSDYVGRRWGLSAGRVHSVKVRDLPADK